MFRGNPEADVMSLPLRGGHAHGARPRCGVDNHRTRGARYRGGRLCLLLPHHVDGRVPEAIHQRHNRFQGSDEHVRQRARVSTG